jgi:CheY-like chemotaxis protein
MQRYSILWADDEIDLLKPHILFLEQRGYDITPVNNGSDAIELCQEKHFDVVFLDENMPGLSGLEALAQIKVSRPNLPVVMITKNQEEHIMEEAIGSQIADYLIKPLNPSQILLSVKKILENKRLILEKTNLNYQQEFRNISMALMDDLDHEAWADIYKKLVFWELQLDQAGNNEMAEVLETQKNEANAHFARFIMGHYEKWLNDPAANKPLLSHQLLKKKVFPLLSGGLPVFLIIIDNLRLDQWKIIAPLLADIFTLEEEQTYYSILPTTTAFARNAIFAGMLPAEIERVYPALWVGDDEEEGKNNFEDALLEKNLRKNNLQLKFTYHKIKNVDEGRDLLDKVPNLFQHPLNVIVYNFVDMLSHARTDMAMIRELAPDESAYRSITHSWFLHSPLFDALKLIATRKARIVITTDHGTIRVKRPFRIIGDRSVNTNLRYKQGKNLGFEGDRLYHVTRPEKLFLPKPNVSTSYAFAIEDHFFVYPNNYNYYANLYRDTFQHGGISLEEMIIPLVFLSSKNAG